MAGPAFYFNANPDPVPNFHFDADPDPAPREIYTYPLGSSGFQTLYGSNVSSQGRALMAPFLAPEFCFFLCGSGSCIELCYGSGSGFSL